MPISVGYKKMIEGMRDSYCEGDSKMVSRAFADGSSISACSKAWSVFFATLRKKGWDESKARLAMGPEDVAAITEKVFNKTKRKMLSFDELEYIHALAHSMFSELGDQACKIHFQVASEMIDRGIPHIRRSLCDGVVELAYNWRSYNPENVDDAVIREDWAIVLSWLRNLGSGRQFESDHFKGMGLSEQVAAVRGMAKNIIGEMAHRGWKPEEMWKPILYTLGILE